MQKPKTEQADLSFSSDYEWRQLLHLAVQGYIKQEILPVGNLDFSHFASTPVRVVKAWEDQISGYLEDPKVYLSKQFSAGCYDEMLHVGPIKIKSICAHHLLPFVGKAYFAYVPKDYIVGLSKIPRFIRALSKRAEVQENLVGNIADIFQSVVEPHGCGVHIRAAHFCMCNRGVEEDGAITSSTALRGVFKDGSTKQEFLQSINRTEPVFP